MLLSLTLSTQAATVQANNVLDGSSETLFAVDATTLLSTGIAALGVFPTGFVPTAGDIPNLITNFTTLTSGPVGGPIADLGGNFPGFVQVDAVSIGNISDASPLFNRTLYGFIGNGATLASSTAFLLYGGLGNIQSDEAGELAYILVPTSGTVPIIGSVGSFTGNASGIATPTTRYTTFVLVPEPSTALLGAVGALALLRRRRA